MGNCYWGKGCLMYACLDSTDKVDRVNKVGIEMGVRNYLGN